jgi:hypothetical protein
MQNYPPSVANSNSGSSSAILHALVLIRLGREEEGRDVLTQCLYYHPQVARYILDRSLPRPENEDRLGGVISGSELEGWLHARDSASEWRSNRPAMTLLREAADPCAKRGWKRYAKAENKDGNLGGTPPS